MMTSLVTLKTFIGDLNVRIHRKRLKRVAVNWYWVLELVSAVFNVKKNYDFLKEDMTNIYSKCFPLLATKFSYVLDNK